MDDFVSLLSLSINNVFKSLFPPLHNTQVYFGNRFALSKTIDSYNDSMAPWKDTSPVKMVWEREKIIITAVSY